MVPIRQSADTRRASVLQAAISEFARSGYAGTSTEAIAARAGISQPYVFRLFGTKKDLFVATYRAVSGRIEEACTAATEGLHGEEALRAMGVAYVELLADPELLQVQLHAFAAAAAEPDIARACQASFRRVAELARERADVGPEELRQFLAHGMLCSVAAAIDLFSLPEEWAQSLLPGDGEPDKRRALQAMRTGPVDSRSASGSA